MIGPSLENGTDPADLCTKPDKDINYRLIDFFGAVLDKKDLSGSKAEFPSHFGMI